MMPEKAIDKQIQPRANTDARGETHDRGNIFF
jgi:hypothetical protein